MGTVLDFSDIPAAPKQGQQPTAYGPGAVFTDTGQSATPAQVAAYQTLAQTGGLDPSQAPGSIRNPYGLRPGAAIPEGAWYTDTNGGVFQAGPGGVQMPAMPQAPQAPQQAGSDVPAATTQPSANGGSPAASGVPTTSHVPIDANGVVNFDDLAPPATLGSDFFQSIPTGLAHAATGVLGAVGNIRDLSDAGVQGAANGVRGLFGYQPITLKPMQTGNALYDYAPDSAALSRDVEGVTGPLYRPQTWAGRSTDTALSMAPAAFLGPETLGARAVAVGVPALTASAAGEGVRAMGHPEWDGAARLAGGVAGGLGLGATMSAPGSAKVMANAARGLSDTDITAAQALRDGAATTGVQVTMPEAVAAATGRGQPLLQAQRAVESTPAGAQAFTPYMAARPGQMQSAVAQFINGVAPNRGAPSMVAPQAQAAADGALTAERQAINAKAAPYYDASRGDLIAPSDYMSLHTNPVYQGALQALRAHPELGPSVADLPDNALGVVDQVARRLATSADQARGSEVMPGDMQLAAIRQAAADRAYGVAAASSPTFAAARQSVASGRAATLDPLAAGPLGTISTSTSLPAQTGALFPPQPFPGQAADTAEALSRMGSIDPSAPGNLVGAHLGRAAAEAFSDTRNGPNLYGGSKFALDVAANPQQAQNLSDAIAVLGGQPAADSFSALKDGLSATGYRLPPRQAGDAELAAALRSHPMNAGEFGVSLAVPMEAAHNPLGLVAYPAMKLAAKGMDALNTARATGNASALAKALLSSDPIATTVGAARKSVAQGDDVRNTALVAALLGSDQKN